MQTFLSFGWIECIPRSRNGLGKREFALSKKAPLKPGLSHREEAGIRRADLSASDPPQQDARGSAVTSPDPQWKGDKLITSGFDPPEVEPLNQPDSGF